MAHPVHAVYWATTAGLVKASHVTFPDLGSTPMTAQEKFLSRFEPDGTGFIYRATPGGHGMSVTADERAEMVALQDDRGGIALIAYIATLPLTAAAGAGLSTSPITSPWASAVSAVIFFGLPVVATVWVDRSPGRILRGRAPVDKGLPKTEVARRVVEARRQSASEGPDLSFALTTIVSVIEGLEVASSNDHSMVVRLLGLLWASLFIGMFVDLMRTGRRIRAQQQRERGGKP